MLPWLERRTEPSSGLSKNLTPGLERMDGIFGLTLRTPRTRRAVWGSCEIQSRWSVGLVQPMPLASSGQATPQCRPFARRIPATASVRPWFIKAGAGFEILTVSNNTNAMLSTLSHPEPSSTPLGLFPYRAAQMDQYALSVLSTCLGVLVLWLAASALYRCFLHPLAKVPGPVLAAITPLYGFYYNALKGGLFYLEIERLHREYGMLYSAESYRPDPNLLCCCLGRSLRPSL